MQISKTKNENDNLLTVINKYKEENTNLENFIKEIKIDLDDVKLDNEKIIKEAEKN